MVYGKLYESGNLCMQDNIICGNRHFIAKYLCKSNTEIAAFVDNNKKKQAKFVSLFALLYIYIYAKM